jgi:hypothetical protein
LNNKILAIFIFALIAMPIAFADTLIRQSAQYYSGPAFTTESASMTSLDLWAPGHIYTNAWEQQVQFTLFNLLSTFKGDNPATQQIYWWIDFPEINSWNLQNNPKINSITIEQLQISQNIVHIVNSTQYQIGSIPEFVVGEYNLPIFSSGSFNSFVLRVSLSINGTPTEDFTNKYGNLLVHLRAFAPSSASESTCTALESKAKIAESYSLKAINTATSDNYRYVSQLIDFFYEFLQILFWILVIGIVLLIIGLLIYVIFWVMRLGGSK